MGELSTEEKRGEVVSGVVQRAINSPSVRREKTTTLHQDGTRQARRMTMICLRTSISMVETQVIGIKGAPKGSRLLYYLVSVRKQAI